MRAAALFAASAGEPAGTSETRGERTAQAAQRLAGDRRALRPKHRELKDTGLVSSCSPDDWLAAWKVDDWNTAKVRVEGGRFPRVTTWINGKKICHFDGDESDNPGYKKQEVAKVTGQAGSVAVQVHGGGGWPKGAKCRWRNVRIRELS